MTIFKFAMIFLSLEKIWKKSVRMFDKKPTCAENKRILKLYKIFFF